MNPAAQQGGYTVEQTFLTISRGPDAASARTLLVSDDADLIRSVAREIGEQLGLEPGRAEQVLEGPRGPQLVKEHPFERIRLRRIDAPKDERPIFETDAREILEAFERRKSDYTPREIEGDRDKLPKRLRWTFEVVRRHDPGQLARAQAQARDKPEPQPTWRYAGGARAPEVVAATIRDVLASDVATPAEREAMERLLPDLEAIPALMAEDSALAERRVELWRESTAAANEAKAAEETERETHRKAHSQRHRAQERLEGFPAPDTKFREQLEAMIAQADALEAAAKEKLAEAKRAEREIARQLRELDAELERRCEDAKAAR